MTAKEITVNVGVKMTVSDEMACRCLRVLEMWQNDNPDKIIIRDTVHTTDGDRFIYRIREEDTDAN